MEYVDEEAPTITRWRCRAHPDQAVTWRGKGCQICVAARERVRLRKRARRDKRFKRRLRAEEAAAAAAEPQQFLQ